MSVEAINRIRGVKCTLAQKAVLTWLAEHAGADMSCFPSLALLAAETCACRSTVKSSLKALESLGLITIKPRPNRSSIYTVVCDVREVVLEGQETTRSGDDPVRRRPSRGSGDDRLEGQETTPWGSGDDPITVKVTTTEPPVEPPPPAGAGGREVDDVAVGPLLLAIESSLMRGVLLNGKQVRGIVAAVNAAPAMLPRLVEAASEAESIRAPLAWVQSVIASGPTSKGKRRRQTSTSGIASDEAWAAMAAEHNAAKRRRAAP